MNNKFQDATIDGQKITAYQLGKNSNDWRNGAGTISDGMDTNKNSHPTRKLTDSAKNIVIYFSRSGSTELLASKIAKKTNADILEITVKDPYPSNYPKTLSRANFERENMDYPELNMELPNLDQYKTVYLGYPIWAMTLSHPMHSFLNTYGSQLSSKKIAPFMSEGGYGQGDSVQVVKEILKQQGAINNTFTSSLVVDGNKVDHSDKQISDWLR
ncbi:flavodoxin family protein [Companilactobacillus tucceti]|uniref:flavodoxin family protein n=1 Tax=Companilactobacillus tucceti TaxID=238012 RepID=UPI000A828801|nr:flavodoxin [Companilactobacillus tucceti]